MVLRFGDSLQRACVILALTLASTVSGHTIHRSGEDRNAAIPEAYNEPVAFAGTDSETAWMVTAIIFIVLFALSIIVCIYLWYLRNAKMKELRYIQNVHSGVNNKDNQNVWYGGGAHM